MLQSKARLLADSKNRICHTAILLAQGLATHKMLCQRCEEAFCRWKVPAAKLDWSKFMKKKRAELQRLNSVYGNILGGANVETIEVSSPMCTHLSTILHRSNLQLQPCTPSRCYGANDVAKFTLAVPVFVYDLIWSEQFRFSSSWIWSFGSLTCLLDLQCQQI